MSDSDTSPHPEEPAEGGEIPDAGPGAERVLNSDRPSEEREVGRTDQDR